MKNLRNRNTHARFASHAWPHHPLGDQPSIAGDLRPPLPHSCTRSHIPTYRVPAVPLRVEQHMAFRDKAISKYMRTGADHHARLYRVYCSSIVWPDTCSSKYTQRSHSYGDSYCTLYVDVEHVFTGGRWLDSSGAWTHPAER